MRHRRPRTPHLPGRTPAIWPCTGFQRQATRSCQAAPRQTVIVVRCTVGAQVMRRFACPLQSADGSALPRACSTLLRAQQASSATQRASSSISPDLGAPRWTREQMCRAPARTCALHRSRVQGAGQLSPVDRWRPHRGCARSVAWSAASLYLVTAAEHGCHPVGAVPLDSPPHTYQ